MNSFMPQTLTLKASGDERRFFSIPPEVAELSQPFNGNVVNDDSSECIIQNNIIRLINSIPGDATLAQRSNFLTLTAKVYENTWRARSIGILSGQPFSLDEEKKLLQSWTSPKPNEWIADIGCSTGFYARSLAEKEPDANIIALDFSEEMLEEARLRCLDEKHQLYLLRADASALPFYAESMDALVCGGSLNEFANPEKVLYEMRRVLKKNGRCFMMHLMKADTWYGRLLQKSSETGGLHFWSEEESDALFTRAGFTVTRRHKMGIVCFSLLHVK